MVDNNIPITPAPLSKVDIYQAIESEWVFASTQMPGLPMLDTKEL
jgi:hypothetical protein